MYIFHTPNKGRSAGGLLIGASINQAPELFKVAICGVPFVDVVPTMVDASIPLTTGEWEEWGNPNEEKFHQVYALESALFGYCQHVKSNSLHIFPLQLKYMMSYSPIQNVKKGAKYPSCLLTGGLHDSRVAVSKTSALLSLLPSSLSVD